MRPSPGSALGEWITYAQAAQLVGCAVSQIQRLVDRGWITSRRGHWPALNRTQVQAAGERWRRDQQARRALAATNRRTYRHTLTTPDDEHTWLTLAQAAQVLGMSRGGVSRRSRRGTLPYTEHAGRRWYRADHMRLIRNARSYVSS